MDSLRGTRVVVDCQEVAAEQLPSACLQLILADVSHELRLQLLGAQFTADVQRTFPLRKFLVPGRQIKNGRLKLLDRGPHDPPTVRGTLGNTTVRTSAAVQPMRRSNTGVSYHQIIGPKVGSLENHHFI